uniref:Uncharacterized protein n=1 Tax=Solanum tuberosum TaxID=4113 RepID=M1BKK2_SOLTU
METCGHKVVFGMPKGDEIVEYMHICEELMRFTYHMIALAKKRIDSLMWTL